MTSDQRQKVLEAVAALGITLLALGATVGLMVVLSGCMALPIADGTQYTLQMGGKTGVSDAAWTPAEMIGAAVSGLAGIGGVGGIIYRLGRQTGRHIGYDEAEGATPAPGQPGSVPLARPPSWPVPTPNPFAPTVEAKP